MEEKYLNEERYQRQNSKIKLISLVIFVCGLLIGGGLIAFGLIKQNEAEQQKQTTLADTSIRIDKIQNEISSQKVEAETKQEKCEAINMNDPDWFEKNNKCEQEVSSVESMIDNLESEQFELEHQIPPDPFTAPFYIFGVFIIIGSVMISLAIWLFTKRRAIRAYSAQQTMPVNKEIINEYSETVADAAGKIANAVKQDPNQKPNDK